MHIPNYIDVTAVQASMALRVFGTELLNRTEHGEFLRGRLRSVPLVAVVWSGIHVHLRCTF